MEEKINLILKTLNDFREENNKRWDENDRRWEENERRWEQNEKRWEENERKWEQNEKCWEENEKRWKQNEQSWQDIKIELVNLRKSIRNDMDKMFEAIENIAGKGENEITERKDDISKINGRLKLHSIRINRLENKVSN